MEIVFISADHNKAQFEVREPCIAMHRTPSMPCTQGSMSDSGRLQHHGVA